MDNHIFTFALASILFVSCNNNEKTVSTDNTSNVSQQDIKNNGQLDSLKTEASRLRGGGSIKLVELESGVATLLYVSDFQEYKELNPQSSLSESELKGYWEAGDAIKKALVDGSVRLMRKLPFLNEVSIILPVNKQTYSISVSKPLLEKFVDKDFKTIIENWDSLFSDPFVYNKNGRDRFFKEFGTIK